jgi:aspartyl-tRNA(Asn)/glutamyl-tRNA(Gln) amidotransferase subunit C
MKITEELIDRLANLSRLEFQGEEKVAIQQDMERMLDFIEKLNEIDTVGIAPLVHIHADPIPLRTDVISEEISHQQALGNAPDHDTDYFRVPRVLDKDK